MKFDSEYICDSIIGEGGMGKVIRARQLSLDRWVALKVLTRARDRKAIERFYREARAAAKLVHANIIQIHTVREFEGIPYIAMEYIDGGDLQSVLKNSPEGLTPDEIGEIVRSVAKALDVAAQHGITHRDVKPENIMITRDGTVKVADFGLAKSGSDMGLTEAGIVVGTPYYMAPEQCTGDKVDTRSDIYALGCVLYELLYHNTPFTAESLTALMYKQTHDEPIWGGRVPEYEKICKKMMLKKPEERYQTPGELLEALAKIPRNTGQAEMRLAERAGALANSRKPTQETGDALRLDDFRPKSESIFDGLASVAHGRISKATKSKVKTRKASGLKQRTSGFKQRSETDPYQMLKTVRTVAPPKPEPGVQRDSGFSTEEKDRSPLLRELRALLPEVNAKKFRAVFQKMPDARWCYEGKLAACEYRAGIAAKVPSATSPTPGLGDCLLCANWNSRVGCALAYHHFLAARGTLSGFNLVVEQATAWANASRFDIATLLLDTYIEEHPDEPEPYRALAFIYERATHKIADKRRAVILLKRFCELAKQSKKFSEIEISRAAERALKIDEMLRTVDLPGSALAPGEGFLSQCFIRAKRVFFAHVVITLEKIIIARAGTMDPETGIAAAELDGAFGRAMRMLKSDPLPQPGEIKNEIARLSALSLSELEKDRACETKIELDKVKSVTMKKDERLKIRCVTITAGHTHQLLFPEQSAFKADQCVELLKRKLSARF